MSFYENLESAQLFMVQDDLVKIDDCSVCEGDLARQCGWCNKWMASIEQNQALGRDDNSLEDSETRIRELEAMKKVLRITHGICTSCFKAIEEGIE
jgi:hypothetical protein